MSTRSRRPLHLRQPVSCEPCRRRKIRCSRSRVPCDSCVRRGCSSACSYPGDHGSHADGRHRGAVSVGNSSIQASAALPSHEDLVARIQNIEGILSNRLDQNDTSLYSPPTTAHSSETPGPQTQTRPTSDSQQSSSTEQDPGILDYTDDGFVTYRPAQTQWLSVLKGQLIKPWPQVPLSGPNSSQGCPMENSSAARVELIAQLPPVKQCSEILDSYFEVFSPLFHVLFEPFFHEQYDSFRKSPGSCTLTWLALLYAMLSIGVTALHDNNVIFQDNRTNRKALAERYRGLTLRCLTSDGYLWRHNLTTLQALELLIYATNHSQGSSWALLGMTYHIALGIGCHVDPSRFGLSEIQCEERRRAWAGLRMLYTIQNVSMGAFGSPLVENNVLPPADVDDSDLSEGRVMPRNDRPTQMTYLLFKFGLYELAADIAKLVTHPTEPSREEVMHLDERILHQQSLWDVRYSNDSRHDNPSTHQTMQLFILYTYSHQLVLLLHRPFFRGPQSHPRSFDRCTSAAMALLDVYKSLTGEPNFQGYMWYICGLGSFYAFHAAAVLVAVLVEGSTVNDVDTMRDMLNSTLTCFDGLRERSQVCEQGARVLRHILNESLMAGSMSISHASHDLYAAYNTTIEDIFDMFGTSTFDDTPI